MADWVKLELFLCFWWSGFKLGWLGTLFLELGFYWLGSFAQV